MRLVAGFAGNPGRVLLGVDLLDGGGLRCAGSMAACAQDRGVQFGRLHRGVFGMFRQGTVARFAVHMGVPAGRLHLQDVGVAGLTRLMASVVNRPSGDFADRCSAVVPVLAEALWDDEMPQCQEHDKGNHKQKSESKEVPDIFEGVHRERPFPSAGIDTLNK